MTSTLVLGGARSGKSRYAERLLADAPRALYVATGYVPDGSDPEWAARVATHQARRPAGWRTVETVDPAAAIRTADAPVLVDCLGTWLTRVIDEAAGWEDPARAETAWTAAVAELVEAVRGCAHDVVLVSNEVGSGLVPTYPAGRLFRDELGRLNAAVGAGCDRVVLAVAGRVLEPLAAAPAARPERVAAPLEGAPTSEVRRSWQDPWRLAFGTLTAWPVPTPVVVDRVTAGRAMVIAPLVVLPLLVLLALPAWYAATAGLAPTVVAGVLVVLHVLSTRGMHLDGLADTCDGLSASDDREKALRIMRTGDLGPSGAGAVALCLLLQVVSLAQLIERGPGALALGAVAVLTSRHALAWGCRRGVSPARPRGLGATVAQSVSPAVLGAATAVLLAAATAGAWAVGLAWWTGTLVAAAGVAAAYLVVQRAVRRIGGITGDVLGATIEISLTTALAVGAFIG